MDPTTLRVDRVFLTVDVLDRDEEADALEPPEVAFVVAFAVTPFLLVAGDRFDEADLVVSAGPRLLATELFLADTDFLAETFEDLFLALDELPVFEVEFA